MALTVRLVYGLPLRQTEGFLQSISTLLDLGLCMLDHCTLSRRSKRLNVQSHPAVKEGPFHIMIDSTGLRVHSGNGSDSGPPPKRRAWRKLHFVVNADTGDILASALTSHRARDAAQVPVLLAQVDNPLACAMADRAYDTSSVYAAIEAHGSGYTRRSLVETAMSRYKAIIGGAMRSRTMAQQRVEVTLACKILNRITYLGMPDGYCI